jgi:predicted DNA-binding protein
MVHTHKLVLSMNQTKEKTTKRTSVSFPTETYRIIQDLAKQKKLSITKFIQDVVEKYIAEKDTHSIADQNMPVKVNDLNTLYPPAVEIPATTNIDVIDLGKDPYAEVDSVYVQLSDIFNSLEYSETPEVHTLFIKNMIPIYNDITDDCISKIKLFATVTEIDEFYDMLNFIYDEQTKIFVRYMLNLISTTIIMALKYRYAIVKYGYFQYVTQYNEFSKILKDNNNIKEDIDNIVLAKIRKLFCKPSVKCLKIKNDSKIGIITTTVETGILVLPHVYGYEHNSKIIFQLGNDEKINLNIVYQQAFKLFDEYTLYIDVYDRALNHYRVWRLGRDILSSTKFEVENIQRF